MKKVILIGLLFFCHCTSPQQKGHFDLPLLEKISQLTLIEPPPDGISFTSVYVIGNNDSIYESNFENLRNVYKTSYKNQYIKFSNFLFKALNQKIKLETKNPKIYLYFSRSFVIEPNIKRLYHEQGIKGLIERYCVFNGDLYTLIDGDLTLNEFNSISYYFFLNKYVRADDDYEATINFKKIDVMINKQH
ncbi:MAG: hypothetical protein KGZ59_00540 [Chitinophagaceae bacterium]|nr:hypothetical protein [Chitinophagaceae bacterium]